LPADAAFIGEFVEECSAFPNAAHDDQVDAMTQALHKLLLTGSLLSFFRDEKPLDPQVARPDLRGFFQAT
jgi:hypothetical protein